MDPIVRYIAVLSNSDRFVEFPPNVSQSMSNQIVAEVCPTHF